MMKRTALYAPGLRLSALQASQRPLLWLHGLNLHAWAWELFLTRAGGTALDLRGHGHSDAPADGYWLGALTADVACAAAALGLRRFVLVGHAWGARVALGVAASYPDAVERLVLIEGGVDLAAEAQASLTARMEAFPDRDVSLAVFRQGYPAVPERAARPIVRRGQRPGQRWHSPRYARVAIAEQWNLADGLGLAARVRCPTLVVRADDSFHWTRQQAASLVAALPDARLATVPGSHYVVQDNPDGLWEVIRHEGPA